MMRDTTPYKVKIKTEVAVDVRGQDKAENYDEQVQDITVTVRLRNGTIRRMTIPGIMAEYEAVRVTPV